MRARLRFALLARRGGRLVDHIYGERVDHSSIHAVEALNLLCEFMGLVVDIVNRTHLQTDALQVKFVHLIDTGERAVEILHLFTVARQAGTLLVDLLEGIRERL